MIKWGATPIITIPPGLREKLGEDGAEALVAGIFLALLRFLRA